MTDHPYRDPLSPLGTLTVAERDRARQVAQADPGSLEPAILAALNHADATVERMLALIRGEAPCGG